MDKPELEARLHAVRSLQELFGRDLNDGAIGLFMEATADISLDRFRSGIKIAARQCRFMPSPAEFRELSVGRKSRIPPM